MPLEGILLLHESSEEWQKLNGKYYHCMYPMSLIVKNSGERPSSDYPKMVGRPRSRLCDLGFELTRSAGTPSLPRLHRDKVGVPQTIYDGRVLPE